MKSILNNIINKKLFVYQKENLKQITRLENIIFDGTPVKNEEESHTSLLRWSGLGRDNQYKCIKASLTHHINKMKHRMIPGGKMKLEVEQITSETCHKLRSQYTGHADNSAPQQIHVY